jgi:hypothetical protein
MADPKPANTLEIGANAYLLESPLAGTTDCFVMAHGGSVDNSQKFDLPAGVSVKFFVRAGVSNQAPAGPLGFIRTQMDRHNAGQEVGSADRAFTYVGSCPDYILQKAFDTHWKVAGVRAKYVDIRNEMDGRAVPGHGANWIPHIVTVRNRTSIFRDKNVWLSTLVKEILKAKPAVTTIYCGNCRDDDAHRKDVVLKTVGKPSLKSRTKHMG